MYTKKIWNYVYYNFKLMILAKKTTSLSQNDVFDIRRLLNWNKDFILNNFA